jgi:hypothetical protein
MIDRHKVSEVKSERLSRTFGPSSVERPGTLSPDPWHFALCASSMVQEQGDATTRTTSPMPLDCCGAQGACRQSPILHRSNSRLPAPPAISKRQTERLYHAIGPKRQMPGVWGQSPQEPASTQRPDEPDVMGAGRILPPCHSRADGNPVALRAILDPRLRGGDITRPFLSDAHGTERSI